MVKMPGPRRHKPYPSGDRDQMTPEWKEDVRRKLRDRDVSEQWLADRVAERRGMAHMKRDTINKLLNRQRTSALVPDICAILGLDPPMTATPAVTDEEMRLAFELLREASPEQRRAVILLLRGRSKSA